MLLRRNKEGGMDIDQTGLVKASDLERLKILPRGTVYRMQRLGLIPAYRVGAKGRGVRFLVGEVLAALRRPRVAELTQQTVK